MRALAVVVCALALAAIVVGETSTSWTWDSPGNKVFHHSGALIGDAPSYNVIICYAGWNVSGTQSQAWTQTWFSFLSSTGVGAPTAEVYAVAGPADPGYSGKEIGNSKLIQDLSARIIRYRSQGKTLGRVIVLAHSSGSFVAHEFLQELIGGFDPLHLISGKVDYFNLDGGQSGLSVQVINQATHYCYFTYSFDSATRTYSPNADSMKGLQEIYGLTGKTMLVENDASNSSCDRGAQWCVHMTLINVVPYNSEGADPWLDYTSFKQPHILSTAFLKYLKL